MVKLVSLQKTTPVNDPHELSMAHFVNRALGDQTQMSIADGWQGYVIQNLVENLLSFGRKQEKLLPYESKKKNSLI